MSVMGFGRWLYLLARAVKASGAAVPLFFLFFAAGLFRLALSLDSPYYSPITQDGFYPAEAGMQFRWAECIAHGRDVSSAAKRAQFPEGLRPDCDITLGMERVAGALYRLLFSQHSSFFHYSIWYVAYASLLPLFAVYAWARLLRVGVFSAILGAALYAVHPLSVERVLRNFGHENFALVFLFLVPVFLTAAWQLYEVQPSRSAWHWMLALVAAAATQWFAFASWHMARPIFALTLGCLTVVAFISWLDRDGLRLAAGWLLLVIPAAFALPVLRCRNYWIDPAVLLALGFSVVALTTSHPQSLRKGLIMVLGAVAMLSLRPRYPDSHVMALLVDKLRHGLIKPDNPNALSAESRLMWIEAFHSLRMDQFLFYVMPLALALSLFAIMGRSRLLVTVRRSSPHRFFMALLASWVLVFVLVYRLHVLAMFGLSVGFAMTLDAASRNRLGNAVSKVIAVVLLLLCTWQTATLYKGNFFRRAVHTWFPPPAEAFVPRLADTRDLLGWIRRNTAPDDVFAAWFGLSSQIYAYANRPVVVQSKFENPTIRPKCLELAHAMYGPPENLATFCKKYGARYFVYEASLLLCAGIDSVRYVAGLRKVPTTSTVALMHLRPFELSNFELVYQNGSYRVFRVLMDSDVVRNDPVPWEPVFERSYYNLSFQDDYYDDSRTTGVVAKVNKLAVGYEYARALLMEGQVEAAAKIAQQILAAEPRYWQAAALFSRIALMRGDVAMACRAAAQALQNNPLCQPAIRLHSRLCDIKY